MISSRTVTVVARISAKAGLEERVKEELLALVSATRKESGCINYDLHQASDNKGLFLFYENWVSREDLDEHLKMPYLQGFLNKADDLLASPVEIMLWEMVSQPAK